MDLRKGMRRTWYEYALNTQCKTTEINLEWAWSSGERVGLAPQGSPVRFAADAPHLRSIFLAFYCVFICRSGIAPRKVHINKPS